MNGLESPTENLVRDYCLDSLLVELMAASSPHQRAVLGLMAVSHCHGLPLAPMLSRLAGETSGGFSSQAMYLAALVHSGEPPVDALRKTTLVLTPTVVKALGAARDDEKLDQLYHAVLQRSQEYGADLDFGNEDDGRFSHLIKRGLFVMATILFIMLKIVPEFQKMFQEFEVELPALMKLAMSYCDLAAKFWFLGLLVVIPVGIWMFRRQLRRWNPVTWRQPIISKSARRRRILAIESRDAGQPPAQWDELAAQGVISKREARVLANTASGETRAWLLRWKANAMGESSKFRSSMVFNFVIWFGNIALALIVFVMCAAILSSLIQMIGAQ